MPPEVLTCHCRDVVAWLQAVRGRHQPLLIDDGRATEAHAVAVHQVDLREQKAGTSPGLCKSVEKRSGTWGFCLAVGQAVFRLYRPKDAAPRGVPAPRSPALCRGWPALPHTRVSAPLRFSSLCGLAGRADSPEHKPQHKTEGGRNTSASTRTS